MTRRLVLIIIVVLFYYAEASPASQTKGVRLGIQLDHLSRMLTTLRRLLSFSKTGSVLHFATSFPLPALFTTIFVCASDVLVTSLLQIVYDSELALAFQYFGKDDGLQSLSDAGRRPVRR